MYLLIIVNFLWYFYFEFVLFFGYFGIVIGVILVGWVDYLVFIVIGWVDFLGLYYFYYCLLLLKDVFLVVISGIGVGGFVWFSF